MESKEMMMKMAISCKVLNDVLRNPERYKELRIKYQELVDSGKMHKMNDLYDLCNNYAHISKSDKPNIFQ